MYFTPEFQATVVLLSSPVASAVTLWGMRSPATASSGPAENPTQTKTALKGLDRSALPSTQQEVSEVSLEALPKGR